MPSYDDTLPRMQPHTKAKHQILEKYLSAWFPIMGATFQQLVYIDGFAGSGLYAEGDLGSPIIALKAAIEQSKEITSNIDFIFIEERRDRYDHLLKEVSKLEIPKRFQVIPRFGEFSQKIMEFIPRSQVAPPQIIPMFAFLDPTGYEGLPFELVKEILNRKSSEVFITLMESYINRFIRHPDKQIRSHIISCYGTEQVINLINDDDSRMKMLRLLYQSQLHSHAKYVQYFELRDKQNKPLYDLFFASNHPKGYLKMKEAMWKVDPEGSFSFSDADDPNQLLFFSEDHTKRVANLMLLKFRNKGDVSGKEVREFIENSTFYINKHKTEALRELEGTNPPKIDVGMFKLDGKSKRRKSSFPDDVLITFI